MNTDLRLVPAVFYLISRDRLDDQCWASFFVLKVRWKLIKTHSKHTFSAWVFLLCTVFFGFNQLRANTEKKDQDWPKHRYEINLWVLNFMKTCEEKKVIDA